MIGDLVVTLVRGADLVDVETMGEQDPYCVININGHVARTRVHTDGGRTPEWNQTFKFSQVPVGSAAQFKVYDKNIIMRDVLIGTANFLLEPQILTGLEVSINIASAGGMPCGYVIARFSHTSILQRDGPTTPEPIAPHQLPAPSMPPTSAPYKAAYNPPGQLTPTSSTSQQHHKHGYSSGGQLLRSLFSRSQATAQQTAAGMIQAARSAEAQADTAQEQQHDLLSLKIAVSKPEPTQPEGTTRCPTSAHHAASEPHQSSLSKAAQCELLSLPSAAAPAADSQLGTLQSLPKSQRSRWIVLPAPGRDINADYHFYSTVIGEGAFGTTYRVAEKASGVHYACKCIVKSKVAGSAEAEEDVRREVQVLVQLAGHPSLVAFRAVYEDRHYVHLVMELCRGGDLFDRIVAKQVYGEGEAAEVFQRIVSAVDYCHSRGVLHRDLKPENFLLAERQDDSSLRLADFGSSVVATGEPLTELAGSCPYMAPEVIRRSYGKEADLWSCGVILYILLSGRPPFFGADNEAIIASILHVEPNLCSGPWRSISPEAKQLVRRLLDKDPSRRATAAEVLAHPWLAAAGAGGGSAKSGWGLQQLQRLAHAKLGGTAVQQVAA